MKTASQMRKETKDKVDALSTETKQKFWRAMREEHKNLGEASKIAGINDTMVAAELTLQCFDVLHIPKQVENVV